jgi:hypothetical protein
MPTVVKPGALNPSAATVLWQSVTPTVTATNAAVGYPAINLIDPATFSSWKGTVAPTSAVYDFGVAVAVNGFGIIAHYMATSASNYSVQHSSDGVAWTTVHTETPLTNDDVFCIFPTVTARYWRILLTAVANIGVFVVGNRLIFPHAPVTSYKPLHHARKYTKRFNDSVGGHFMGTTVLSSGAETDVNMGFFDRSWLENNIRPFEYHYNQGGAFMYAGSPSLYSLDVGYCRSNGNDSMLEIEWTEADKMATLNFGIRSFVG